MTKERGTSLEFQAFVEPAEQLRNELEASYPNYAKDQLEAGKFDSAEGQQYWVNVARLDVYLTELESQIKSVTEPAQVLEIIDEALHRINPREKRFHGLVTHLEEVTEFASQLLLNGETPRFPGLLSEESVQAMTDLAAPVHDLLKFLSAPSGQIMPDHEQVTAFILRKHFGQVEAVAGGVEFAAVVVSDHENIYREEGRQNFIYDEQEAVKAKALFFILDVLTGVIDFTQVPARIDQEALTSRFTDLYVRHIDLIKGKVFRPEWGLYAIRDIITTITYLEKNYDFEMEEGWKKTLAEGAMYGVQEANRGESVYSPEQQSRLRVVEIELASLLKK